MLFTSAFTFLSLVFNLGAVLLLHGSDPNLVTAKRNLQRSIQTIESVATESWATIAVHYKDIFSPPPTSSFSLVDRAERIYRGCAVRILHSLAGSVSPSPRPFSPSPSPLLSISAPAPTSISAFIPTSTSAHIPASISTPISPSISTSISAVIPTDIILYAPILPTCSIHKAPFIVDHVEHPWKLSEFFETNFPYIRQFVLALLVCSVTYAWLRIVCSSLVGSQNGLFQSQDHCPADAPDDEVGPTSKAHDSNSVFPPSSYTGSVATLTDTCLDSESESELNPNSGLDTNFECHAFPTVAEVPSPLCSLPVVVTTSDGQVLFCAEIALSSNQIISTTSSSVKFSVDVVAFRNLSFRESRFLVPLPNSPFQQPSKTFTPPRTATTALTPKYLPSSATANLIM